MAAPRPIGSDTVTISEILDVRAREMPEALAFATEDGSLTYRALHDDAERLARGLLHRGVGRGERVAILLPAGLDVVRLFFALQRIGAAPVIFDPNVPAATSARRIARVRP